MGLISNVVRVVLKDMSIGVYQHFRKEEHAFIDQVLSWKLSVEQTYQRKITDFLDPREQQIIESLIGQANEDLKMNFYGGGEYTERKRVVIAPYYEEIDKEAYQLTLLEASYHKKFITLEHRDVMGAFLSLGISRQKLGDIFVGDDYFQMIVAEEIAPYVMTNLTTVKNATINLKQSPLVALQEKKLDWLESDQTVSSLRLDVVLSEIYNMSRKDAASCLKKNQVKVNFKVVDVGTFQLYEGDLLSLRGKGRSKLVKINGETRKGRLRITTAILRG